jgi:hypothetical protein
MPFFGQVQVQELPTNRGAVIWGFVFNNVVHTVGAHTSARAFMDRLPAQDA